jgi:hypothetical protein
MFDIYPEIDCYERFAWSFVFRRMLAIYRLWNVWMIFFWSLAYGVDIMIPLNNDFRSLLLIPYLDVDFKYSALLPCMS